MAVVLAEVLIAAVVGLASRSAAPPWPGIDRVPADVDLYLHVDDPAALRRSLGDLPLAQAFGAVLADECVTTRWTSIAQRLGVEETQCFDDLLGRELRFVSRRTPAGDDWLLATEIDDATLGRVREGLGGRMAAGGIIEFPCQGLVAAWRPPTLFVSTTRSSPLFMAAIDGAALARRDSLVVQPLLESASRWPRSQMQLYAKHAFPVAGASVWTAELDGRTARLRHRMRLDSTPLDAESPGAAPLNTDVLRRFERLAIAGTVRRQCEDSTLAVISGILPEFEPCDGMRRNAGDRWLMVMGETGAAPPAMYRVPSIAVAVEVREPDKARKQHEGMLRRAIEGFNTRYAATLGREVALPQVAACADLEAPQHCDMNWAFRAVSNDHPLVRTCSLHWRTVAGDNGNWQVYASHREWLDRVAIQLETDEVPVAAEARRSDAGAQDDCDGFVRGRALASMVASWEPAVADFDADDPERCREGVAMLASFLRGMEWIRWRITRPESNLVDTTIRLELAPSATAARP